MIRPSRSPLVFARLIRIWKIHVLIPATQRPGCSQQYAAEYGQVVVNHLNFSRDRISPYITQNASAGVTLYQGEKRSVRFQADVANLSNTLELIDFGGLFSGNAIGPAREYTFRLVTSF